jgi:Domain of unknown function (DUF6456)
MSRSSRAARALIIAEAKGALARLAGEGAYLAAAPAPDGAAGACAVHAREGSGGEPIGRVSRSAVAYSLRKGWLEWDAGGRCLRLSKAGERALHPQGESAHRTGPKPKSRPKSKSTSKAKPRPAAGNRTQLAALRPPAPTPLALLRRRRHEDGRPLVSDAQMSAAEMLAADFWHGELSPRITANWSGLAPARRSRRSTPGAGVEMRDAVVAARQRFQRALDAVGPELAGLLVDVSCHDVGLEAAGRARGWPQRAAKVVLDLALTRLARHYGLIAPERPAAGRLRHWGDADFRPSIDQWR